MKRPTVQQKGNRVGRRLLEITVEVLIAVALVVGITLYAIYVPPESRFLDAKWVGFIVNTVFIIGYALHILRPLWKKPKLWLVILGFVAIHTLVGIAVISRLDRVPLIWYVPLCVAEIRAILEIVGWTFSDEELEPAVTSIEKRSS